MCRDRIALIAPAVACLTGPGKGNYDGILRMPDILFSSKKSKEEKQKVLWEDYGIEMSHTSDEEVSTMWNLAEGIYEEGFREGFREGFQRGFQRGFQEGFQRGFQRGFQEGVVKMKIEIAKELLMSDYSIEAVADFVELPESEVEALAEESCE